MLQLIIIILASVSLGLFSWLSSDNPLMIRELVLNSRKQIDPSESQEQAGDSTQDQYKNAKLLSQFRKIFAVIVWVVGAIAVIVIIFVRLRHF